MHIYLRMNSGPLKRQFKNGKFEIHSFQQILRLRQALEKKCCCCLQFFNFSFVPPWNLWKSFSGRFCIFSSLLKVDYPQYLFLYRREDLVYKISFIVDDVFQFWHMQIILFIFCLICLTRLILIIWRPT